MLLATLLLLAGVQDVAALEKGYKEAEILWKQEYRLSFDPEERRAMKAKHPAVEYLPKFEALAEEGEGRALLFVARLARDANLRAADRKAKKLAAYERVVAEFHAARGSATRCAPSTTSGSAWARPRS